jgi:hypothetical protein
MPRVNNHSSEGAGKELKDFQSTVGFFSRGAVELSLSKPLATIKECTATIESDSPVNSETSEDNVPLAPQE